MSESLGRASLELTADTTAFRAGVKAAKGDGDDLSRTLDALSAVARIAERELGRVKMGAGQAAESKASAEAIVSGVRGISDEAVAAARELDKVRISETQATESVAAGERIKSNLNDIGDTARRARRDVETVRLAGGRNGVGVGPFGSGFGRIGLLGAGIGAGALTGPAAAPALLGLAAAVPAFGAGGAAAVGTLALAFDGVAKAIGGDKKAFDDLGASAQQFVLTVRSLDGWFDKLRQIAGSNLFPGLESGLRAALSPEMVRNIETAVAGLAHALGEAGAAWGRYFGSSEFQSIFGPLMQAAAHNIGKLSDTFLQLFDALGRLAKAAIPFTSWITKAADDGARFADNWLHAKDATGQLGRAMTEAESSLRLVGGLLEALLKVVGALGTALYPVARVAVKDLTDALGALARIIQQNQAKIQEVVGGALKALKDAVSVLWPLVKRLAEVLNSVAESVGGWRAAFDIVLSGLLVAKLGAVAKAIGLIGDAAATAGGEAGVGGLIGKLDKLNSFGKIVVQVAIVETILKAIDPKMGLDFSDPTSTGGSFPEGFVGIRNGQRVRAHYDAQGRIHWIPVSSSTPLSDKSIAPGSGTQNAALMALSPTAAIAYWAKVYGVNAQGALADSFAESGLSASAFNKTSRASGLFQFLPSTWAADTKQLFGHSLPFSDAMNASLNAQVALFEISKAGLGRGSNPYEAATEIINGFERPGAAGAAGDAQRAAQYLGMNQGPGSPFGPVPPFTTNTGATKPAKPPVIPAAASHLLDLASANASRASALSNTGGTAKRYLENELSDLEQADKLLQQKLKTASGKNRTGLDVAATRVENKIREVQKQIKDAIVISGDALLPPALVAKLKSEQAKFNADSAYATILVGQKAQDYQATLLGDLQGQSKTLQSEVNSLKAKLATATGKQKTAIQQELDKVTSSLDGVNQQVLQALEGQVQSLQSNISSAFQSIVSQFDQQFEAQTQAMIDQAGVRFFQNGAQTPLEAQLAQMQAQDQLQSLQDALAQAQTTGDPKQIAAAQRQLDEYQLEIRATQQRKEADEQYAAAVKAITASRTKLEDEMNTKLAALGQALENGTGSVTDLAAIAAEYGLQIDLSTIPSFGDLTGWVRQLSGAIQALIGWISTVTGTSPTGAPQPTQPYSPQTYTVPGLADALAQIDAEVKSGQIPSLDVGGTVLKSGIAMVHRGEQFSGVGKTFGAVRDIVLVADNREIARASASGLSRDVSSQRVVAKAVDPHLARITKLQPA